MWFKQLSFYRLPEAVDPVAVQQALAKAPFQSCTGLDWFSDGWVSPADHANLSMNLNNCTLFTLKRQDKVLPGAAIRDAVEEKAKVIEIAENRKLGRKERQSLKEQITDDLLPRAITRTSMIHGHINNRRQWLMIGSGTASKAEGLISKLREALPPFPARLPRTKITPQDAMTNWLESEPPEGFALDADCELKDVGESDAIIRCSRMDLTADEIRQHIATGKQVTRLGLIWNERIRFVLTDDLRLLRIQFLDVLQEETRQAGDDSASLFDASFAIMSEYLGNLIDQLVSVLGGLTEPSATNANPA